MRMVLHIDREQGGSPRTPRMMLVTPRPISSLDLMTEVLFQLRIPSIVMPDSISVRSPKVKIDNRNGGWANMLISTIPFIEDNCFELRMWLGKFESLGQVRLMIVPFGKLSKKARHA